MMVIFYTKKKQRDMHVGSILKGSNMLLEGVLYDTKTFYKPNRKILQFFFCLSNKKFGKLIFFHSSLLSGKNRLYPTYSVSSSEAEDSPIHCTLYNRPFSTPIHSQPITYIPTPGLSDTPSSSGNISDATLSDSEIALGRDSTLLVHNGKKKDKYTFIYFIFKLIYDEPF